jgi:hypothetical protein
VGMLVSCDVGMPSCTTTDHVLVLPTERLNGISDVSVPFEAFVSVVLLRWVPGEGALD